MASTNLSGRKSVLSGIDGSQTVNPDLRFPRTESMDPGRNPQKRAVPIGTLFEEVRFIPPRICDFPGRAQLRSGILGALKSRDPGRDPRKKGGSYRDTFLP